jgi:hypothetical protein
MVSEGDEGEEEDEDEEFGTEVSFNVTVTKAGQSLVFECTSDGTYVDIRHVAHEPADGGAPDTAYTGAGPGGRGGREDGVGGGGALGPPGRPAFGLPPPRSSPASPPPSSSTTPLLPLGPPQRPRV